jgi:hypothetical protein
MPIGALTQYRTTGCLGNYNQGALQSSKGTAVESSQRPEAAPGIFAQAHRACSATSTRPCRSVSPPAWRAHPARGPGICTGYPLCDLGSVPSTGQTRDRLNLRGVLLYVARPAPSVTSATSKGRTQHENSPITALVTVPSEWFSRLDDGWRCWGRCVEHRPQPLFSGTGFLHTSP